MKSAAQLLATSAVVLSSVMFLRIVFGPKHAPTAFDAIVMLLLAFFSVFTLHRWSYFRGRYEEAKRGQKIFEEFNERLHASFMRGMQVEIRAIRPPGEDDDEEQPPHVTS